MSFDSGDSAALRMLRQFHEGGNLKEWVRAAFAYRLAYKEPLEMFYDEKRGEIVPIVVDELRKLSLSQLEQMRTTLFFKKLLCRCMEIELINAGQKATTAEEWDSLSQDFRELYALRDEILEQEVHGQP